jgi:hypothetical protein
MLSLFSSSDDKKSKQSKDQPSSNVKDAEKQHSFAEGLRLVRSALSARVTSRGGGKKDDLSISLYYLVSASTTAGAAYSTVFSIAPGSSSEFSSLAALYDEYICDGGDMQFQYRLGVAYTTNTGPDFPVWAYDPLDATALGSVVNGMQHKQHILTAGPGINVTAVGHFDAPQAVTKNGLFRFRWRTPPGVARRTTPTVQFGHEWADTADNTAVFGYLKPYLPVLGATGTYQFTTYLTLHCRFRCRS